VAGALAEDARWLEKRLLGAGRSDVKVRPVRDHGSAFARILAQARESRAQLIVLGRHGGGLAGLLVGSTAERVVRGRVAPVLVVARRPARAYRRPLVAIDPEAGGASRLLFFTLRLLGAEAGRVEVTSAYRVLYERSMRRVGATSDEVRRMRKNEASRVGRLQEKVVAEVDTGTARVARTIHHGDPRSVILGLAERRDADLIALRTHARARLARFLLGSVAVEVLRSAECDVLIVPRTGR
jgi:nucleotide-binding universal stress UspA family protein